MKKRTMHSAHHSTANIGVIGGLTPFMACEVAPGDTWSGKVGMLIRMSPLKRPLLQDLYVDQYVFYVPHRLVDSQWEDFIAAGPNGDGTYPHPTVTTPNRSLWQTDGNELTATVTQTRRNWNPYKNRAVNLIYNEFFRDEGIAPVSADNVPEVAYTTPTSAECENLVNTHLVSPKRHYWNELREDFDIGTTASVDVQTGTPNYINADEILRAIAEQKLQMKRATYGTRYVDILKSFGVRVNYQMLQRPEVVAVSHGVINVTDIVATDSGTGLGTTAGYGVLGNRIKMKRKSFPEHGTLIGLVVVRPPFVDKHMVAWEDLHPDYKTYYDPGLELLPYQEVQEKDIIGPLPLSFNETWYMPWGEHYRKQTNRMFFTLEDWCMEHFGKDGDVWDTAGLTLDEIRTWNPLNHYLTFTDFFQDVTYAHYQVAAVNSMRALRLIQKGNPAILRGST